tara:strand:+ start:152 stop:598 length:447 start_codon:yes stop_codon:yes gene_type:complete
MFDSIFGKKTSSSNGDYGKKDESLFTKGIKFVAENAGSVADAASSVGDISGTIASGAATLAGGAAMIGLEPVAAGLGVVAGAAKGVQGAAGLVGRGAAAAKTGAQTARAADIALTRAQRGDLMGAIGAAKTAGAAASATRKQIQRIRK